WTVDRDLDVGDAAGTEVELLAARLMNGPVAQQPELRLQQLRVPPEDLRQMRRAGLLLTFEEDFEPDRRLQAGGAQGIEGGHQADDRRLVIARAAAVEAPLRLQRRAGGDLAASVFQGPVAQDGLPGASAPLGRIHRLPVIVGIEGNRGTGPSARQLAVDHRRAARRLELLRPEAPRLE